MISDNLAHTNWWPLAPVLMQRPPTLEKLTTLNHTLMPVTASLFSPLPSALALSLSLSRSLSLMFFLCYVMFLSNALPLHVVENVFHLDRHFDPLCTV